jgi:hypothetical protein
LTTLLAFFKQDKQIAHSQPDISTRVRGKHEWAIERLGDCWIAVLRKTHLSLGTCLVRRARRNGHIAGSVRIFSRRRGRADGEQRDDGDGDEEEGGRRAGHVLERLTDCSPAGLTDNGSAFRNLWQMLKTMKRRF